MASSGNSASVGGGIWHTTDAGATWGLSNNGLVANFIVKVIADAGSQRVYAASSDGVFRSDNSGALWEKTQKLKQKPDSLEQTGYERTQLFWGNVALMEDPVYPQNPDLVPVVNSVDVVSGEVTISRGAVARLSQDATLKINKVSAGQLQVALDNPTDASVSTIDRPRRRWER